MARYSTFKYGDGTTYGTLTKTALGNLLWSFLVAWDGEYTGFNEASRQIGLTVSRGRDYFIKPSGEGFEHYPPGTAVGTFDNEDGRYDPWNTASPLYPNVKPGKFVRILVKYTATGANYGVMRGIITDIQPVRIDNKPHVRIVVKDGLHYLNNVIATIGIRHDLAVKSRLWYLLDYSSVDSSNTKWPRDEWPLYYGASDAIDETRPYWWAWKQNALEAIHEIEEAELATIFHRRDHGRFMIYGRDWTYLRQLDITEDQILRDCVVPQPWEAVRNDIQVVSHPLVFDESGPYTLWSLGEILPIADGETIRMDARFRYDGLIVAGENVTYVRTVNTQADGGGVDISADCPLDFHEGVGEGTIFDISNNSGSDGFIIVLYFAGDPVYCPYRLARDVSDAASQVYYGVSNLTVDSRWLGDGSYAQNVAAWLLARLKDPSALPIIQVEAIPGIQFYLDLYDRVNLTLDTLGIDASYRIGKIEHEWLNRNGQAVRTIFKLEPYMQIADDYWTFPTLLGETSIFGF